MVPAKLFRFLLLFLGTSLATGCGKVGPPLPPEILIPKPVTDLSSVQIGPQIKLTWTLPTLNTNGTKATTIQKIEVYRQIQPRTDPLPIPETLAKSFQGTKIMVIDIANLSAFTERGKMIFMDKFPGLDPDTLAENQYWYGVKVKSKKGQEAGYSNVIGRQLLGVPPSIPHIDFRGEETMILLGWSRPRLGGSLGPQLIGFNVYRSEQSQVHPPAPLNEKPIPEARFEDKGFQFGTTYYYTVRSVVQEKTWMAESLDSPEFAFKPVDVFPPKPPTGLTLVFADGRMNLAWDSNSETDFAGYNLYRGEDGISFKKINGLLLKSPTFRDDTIEAGKTYFYRVAAVDNSGNESRPSNAAPGKATP